MNTIVPARKLETVFLGCNPYSVRVSDVSGDIYFGWKSNFFPAYRAKATGYYQVYKTVKTLLDNKIQTLHQIHHVYPKIIMISHVIIHVSR